MLHAIKIEDLDITTNQANDIKDLFNTFLLDLDFQEERIEELECRSRDGFIANSYNKGGLSAVAYRDQYPTYLEKTGFKNTDDTLEDGNKHELECFLKENKNLDKDPEKWSDSTWESFSKYQTNSNENTVLFGCDLMLNSETECNVRITICAKDSPYHRKYDDLIDIDVEFKDLKDLKKQLESVLKREDVQLFNSNLKEAY